MAFTKMTSEALAGNLIGDQARRTSYILLPPGYETSEKRYPLVYMLNWYSGDATNLVEHFQQSYQAALAGDAGQEMTFVFPDASKW